MPQELSFAMPIPAHPVSPDRIGARDRNLAWARRHQLITSEEMARRYLFSQVAELSAYTFPDAVGEDLDLAFDVMGWFFLFDDQFDVPHGTVPTAAITACEQLIDLLHQPPGADPAHGAAPVVVAFADCWRRQAHGMSQRYRWRAAANWLDYLEGNLTEEADRRAGTRPDAEQRMHSHRSSGGVRPSFDLAERVAHLEIPPLVWHSTHLESLRLCAGDSILIVNDFYSLDADEARGDPNLVTCLMAEYSYGRDLALDVVRALHDRIVDRFLTLRAQIPELCGALALTQAQRTDVTRYVESLRCWIRGNYDWSRSNGRYSPSAAATSAPAAYGYLHPDAQAQPPS
ncbi:pentalenene synthase [Streptomyces sp. NPDC006385]|uniref:terpene synthase family protein n=1 Tax=Streptomyces sp. NPDC006385 TaxID=3156761 RepID=UPI0033BA60F0